ncbi:MAG: ERCC4 domain-containing protein [Gaiellaceae bacterium]
MPAGDYALGADTLVERKRVLDLHAAVLKGRLWPQLGKLRAACAFPYLLVEGSDLDRGPLHHNAVRGVCLAVIDQGIALLRSGYQRDSALWIHRLADRCQEVEPAAERPAYAQRPRARPGNETAEALLASVPGISTTSARALLEQFGTVAAVAAAAPPTGSPSPASVPSAPARSKRPSTSVGAAIESPTEGRSDATHASNWQRESRSAQLDNRAVRAILGSADSTFRCAHFRSESAVGRVPTRALL